MAALEQHHFSVYQAPNCYLGKVDYNTGSVLSTPSSGVDMKVWAGK